MESTQARIRYAACPLCDSKDFVEAMIGDCSAHPLYQPSLPPDQLWLECRACGHIYVEGYFTPTALATVLSATSPDQLPGFDIEGQRDIWARVVDAVSSLRAALGGRWLDVGFGNGSLLTTAMEFGYEVVGLDLREESVRLMGEFGFEVYALDLEQYRAGELFDVVSMADVLEHMPFPKRALERARGLLRADGLLFLSMPNADSFLWQMLNQNGANPYWGELEHYHNFGRRRLYALLAETGFQPLRYRVSARYRACMEVIARKVDAGRSSDSA